MRRSSSFELVGELRQPFAQAAVHGGDDEVAVGGARPAGERVEVGEHRLPLAGHAQAVAVAVEQQGERRAAHEAAVAGDRVAEDLPGAARGEVPRASRRGS